MKEKFVICYYGNIFIDMLIGGHWRNKFIGKGIVEESIPFDFYPNETEIALHVKLSKEDEVEYDYIKIEKRYY